MKYIKDSVWMYAGIRHLFYKGTSYRIGALRGGEGAIFLAIKPKKNFAFRYARAEPEGGNGLWSW